ncbi:MAG: hypothetical protein JKY94_16635 [Rhodobacteraceae bacterium]|nr:hypothetical protein [Paracoccaceae bacterium]
MPKKFNPNTNLGSFSVKIWFPDGFKVDITSYDAKVPRGRLLAVEKVLFDEGDKEAPEGSVARALYNYLAACSRQITERDAKEGKESDG